MPDEKIIEKTPEGDYFVQLSKEYYEKEPVFAAAEMFLDRFHIKIDSLDTYVGIWFSSKFDEQQDNYVKQAILDFCNEAIHQQVCRDLEKEYGSLRDKVYTFVSEPIKD